MNAAKADLLHRRERLLLRSERLRVQWAAQVQALRRPLAAADKAREATHWLLAHPEWPLGAAALVLVLRPARTLRWAGYALQGYSLYRRAQRLMWLRPPPPR